MSSIEQISLLSVCCFLFYAGALPILPEIQAFATTGRQAEHPRPAAAFPQLQFWRLLYTFQTHACPSSGKWSNSLTRAATSRRDPTACIGLLVHSASETLPAMAVDAVHPDNRVTPASGAVTSRCYTAGVAIEWRLQHNTHSTLR